jgi:citrate lyase subunit beta / citryl-CoA lyase
MALPLSYLFVPGTRPERFAKALASGAGTVILDLEDAVAPQDKATARSAVAAWLVQNTPSPVPVLVRINAAGTPWYGDDLTALRAAGARGLMLPKCESPQHITDALQGFTPAPAVVAIIESARGVQQVDTIAATPGLQRLAFGTLDYAVDLDLPAAAAGLDHAAARIAIASRAAGIAAPVAGVTPELDTARVAADLRQARSFGFGAKLCIHPLQVAAVHDTLRPTDAERAWAQRVLEATAGSTAAVQLDGRMVDRPVVLQAQTILERSR